MNDHTPTTVGVDISKAHLDAHELPSGRAARFDNNAAGIRELFKWISPDVVCVVYESTGPCHRALEETLAGQLPLARVNAMRARRFAQAIGQEAKTDAVDAKVLAKMGASVNLRRVHPREPAQRDLAELRTARDARCVIASGHRTVATRLVMRSSSASSSCDWSRSIGRSKPWTPKSTS